MMQAPTADTKKAKPQGFRFFYAETSRADQMQSPESASKV